MLWLDSYDNIIPVRFNAKPVQSFPVHVFWKSIDADLCDLCLLGDGGEAGGEGSPQKKNKTAGL